MFLLFVCSDSESVAGGAADVLVVEDGRPHTSRGRRRHIPIDLRYTREARNPCRDGQIVLRPSCPLGSHSPQFGYPGLIPGGIIVPLHRETRKIHWATKVPTLIAQ